jgi:hypothetical protein
MDENEAWNELRKRLVEVLSDYVTKGLIQVTIEEIAKDENCRGAAAKKDGQECEVKFTRLPALKPDPFDPYVEVVVRAGAMEMKPIRFDFTVQPQVEVKNAKIVFKDGFVKAISLGTLEAKVSLSLKNGKQKIPLHTWTSQVPVPEITFNSKPYFE